MIKIENLCKTFWDINIFKNLNLELKPWDFISIIWPSWSGKSTLLNLISGIDKDFSWDIKINNTSLNSLSKDETTNFRGKNISYIFQNFRLIDNLTVKENIDLIIEINNLKRVFFTKEILKLVWLEHKENTYAYNLSWWESQRVAIARAFVWETKLLLADEPTWSLDIKNKKNIMDLIVSLHKKTKNTIITITHDQDIANMADEIYELKNYSLIKYKNV